MNEIQQILKKQAKWQRSRAALSWEEKLRASLTMRASLGGFAHSGRSTRNLRGPPSVREK